MTVRVDVKVETKEPEIALKDVSLSIDAVGAAIARVEGFSRSIRPCGQSNGLHCNQPHHGAKRMVCRHRGELCLPLIETWHWLCNTTREHASHAISDVSYADDFRHS